MNNNLIDFPDYSIRPLDAMKFAEKNKHMKLVSINSGYRIDIKMIEEYCPLVVLRQDDVSVKPLFSKLEMDTGYFSLIMRNKESFNTLTKFLGSVSRNPFSESLYLVLDDDEIEVEEADYQLPDDDIDIDLNFNPEIIMNLISNNRGLIKTNEKTGVKQDPVFYAYENTKRGPKRKNLVPLAKYETNSDKWKPVYNFSDIFYNEFNIKKPDGPNVSENIKRCFTALTLPYVVEMPEFRERPNVEIASEEEERTEYRQFLTDAQLCHRAEEALEKSFPISRKNTGPTVPISKNFTID